MWRASKASKRPTDVSLSSSIGGNNDAPPVWTIVVGGIIVVLADDK